MADVNSSSWSATAASGSCSRITSVRPGDPERLECCRPLLGAQLGESGPRDGLAGPKAASPSVTARIAQPVPAQDDLSHQSADPEDLVVGVGRDDGQAAASVT